MKKLFIGLGLGALIFGGTVFGQNAKRLPISKKHVVKYENSAIRAMKLAEMENFPMYASPTGSLLDNTGMGDVSNERTNALTFKLIGRSGNVYSIIKSNVNQVFTYKVDSTQQIVGFVHRNNHRPVQGGFPAYTNGHPRFDISFDGGANWSVDLGPLWEDAGISYNGTTVNARYPQGIIVNPLGGSTIADLRLVETMAGWSSESFGTGWGWDVLGLGWDVQSFTAATAPSGTENLTKWYGIPNARMNALIPTSLTYNTYNGTTNAWMVNLAYDAANGVVLDTLYLTKLNFEGNADSLSVTRIKFSPKVNILGGSARLGEGFVAFSPDGQHGWFACTADIDDNGDPNVIDTSSFEEIPCFYYSSDGGATWSQNPITVSLRQFPEITEALKVVFIDTINGVPTPVDSTTQVPNVVDFKLVVDKNNNPHFVGTAVNYYKSNPFPHPDSIGFVTVSPKVVFDLTTSDMGQTWKVRVLDTLWFTYWQHPDQNGGLEEWYWTQAGRSYDGKVIAYGWINDPNKTDTSSTLTTGYSDLVVAGFRVTDSAFIAKNNVTASTTYNGNIYWPQMGQTLLDGTNPGEYEVPVVFTKEQTANTNPVQWYYIGGITLNFGVDTSNSAISQIRLEDFTAYPNPVQSNLVVKWNNTETAVMQILDIQGRVIYSKEILPGRVNENIDMTQMPTGIYLLKVTNSKGVFTTKIVKE